MRDLFGNEEPPRQPKQRRAILVHQMMLKVFGISQGNKCKGCSHFHYRMYANKYPKCALSGCDGHSFASDWSGKWQACGKFSVAPKES